RLVASAVFAGQGWMRLVPVLARYHDRLVASAVFAGQGWMIGGIDPDRHNVTTPLISSLAGGADLGRLQTHGCVPPGWRRWPTMSGVATFLAAAGVTCSQRLGDIAATLTVAPEAEAVALLGDAS